jgi:uncharacterized protein (DUF58 family)
MDQFSNQPSPASHILRNGVLALCLLGLVYGVGFHVRLLFCASLSTLLTCLILWIYTKKSASQFVLERHHPTKALEDQTVVIHITLTNRSFLPAFSPTVIDFFPPDKAPYHTMPAPAVMWPGSSVKLSYKGLCFNKRGQYVPGPARVVTQDPFGLFNSLGVMTNLLTTGLTVLPAIEQINTALAADPQASRSQAFGEQSLPRPGQSLDFHGLREYRPGDPARFIHWPLSAHRNRLLVKEFDRSQPQQTLVFLNLEMETLRGLGRHSTHEYGIRAAASFVAASLSKALPAGLFVQSEPPLIFPPSQGLHGMTQILNQLALTRPIDRKDGSAFWDFMVEQGRPFFKSRYSTHTLLVLPSIIPDFKTILAKCQYLQSYGHSVQIHFINGSSFLPLRATKKRPGQEFSEFIRVALRLQQVGIQVTVQKNGQSLQESLIQNTLQPRIRVREKMKSGGRSTVNGI